MQNDDVRPIEKARRTWTFTSFHNFCTFQAMGCNSIFSILTLTFLIILGVLINCNTATFLTGSALIPLGLTWWQAIICESSSCQLFVRY
jgi:NCS1 family nucleobase:cation symporter-1